MDSYEDVVNLITSVMAKVDDAQISRHQCRRLADRFNNIRRSIRLWKKGNDQCLVGDQLQMPMHASPFESLLIVLRKGESLVTECTLQHWVAKALMRADNQEAFDEIHRELDMCKTLLPFVKSESLEVDTEDFETAPEERKKAICTSDAEEDRVDLLKKLDHELKRSPQGNSGCPTMEQFDKDTLEKVRTVVTEKFDDAKDELEVEEEDLPSYVQISSADIRDEVIIGAGSYGVVSRANWLGCLVAVKSFPWSGGYTEAWYSEAVPLVRLRHPHVVQLMGFSPSTGKAVMELMDTDLRALIDSRLMDRTNGRGEPFTRLVALDIISQIARGLHYLHHHGYMHGDRVLSMNILVKESDNHNIDVKIGDFGVAQYLLVDYPAVHEPDPMNNRNEVIRWMPPEIHSEYIEGGAEHFSTQADIYSFGILCSEILTGNLPFKDSTDMAAIQACILAGERPQLPDNLDEDLERLIRLCWHPNSHLRPTAERICHVLDHIKYPVATQQDLGANILHMSNHLGEVGHQDPNGAGQDEGSKKTVNLPDHLHIPAADLKLLRRIGSGGCASVFEAKWLGSKCAVKTFSKQSLNFSELQDEVGILMKLRHPHIVQLLGFSAENDKGSIVMEVMPTDLRSLLDTLGQQGSPFTFHTALSVIKQIAVGMAFLHSLNIMHRDLKASNVLVRQETDFLRAKITDFGVSQHIEYKSSCGGTGTGYWRSPEVFAAMKSRSTNFQYTRKVDVYSFAMTCYEILTGKIPFQGCPRSQYEFLLAGTYPPPRPPLPIGLNENLAQLIANCWDDVPGMRPDFSEICARLLPL